MYGKKEYLQRPHASAVAPPLLGELVVVPLPTDELVVWVLSAPALPTDELVALA